MKSCKPAYFARKSAINAVYLKKMWPLHKYADLADYALSYVIA